MKDMACLLVLSAQTQEIACINPNLSRALPLDCVKQACSSKQHGQVPAVPCKQGSGAHLVRGKAQADRVQRSHTARPGGGRIQARVQLCGCPDHRG